MVKPFVNTLLNPPVYTPVCYTPTATQVSRVTAIKFIRQICGIGLKEAKDMVDANCESSGPIEMYDIAELVCNLSRAKLLR